MQSRRPDCIRRLIICDDVTRSFSPQLPMPAVLTATVLGSQRSSLQVLCLTIGVSGLNGSDFAALLVLTQLRHLKVRLEPCAPMLPKVTLQLHHSV